MPPNTHITFCIYPAYYCSIETMFRSLDILKNLPGNLEREETCETFKNSLLSALRPIVRRDVAGIDIAPLQEYLYVFQKLGR